MGKPKVKREGDTPHIEAADHADNGLADLCLYHWAPRERRKQILKMGLVPGSRSVSGDWKPPYVCFSDDPLLAWTLSGKIHPEIEKWDLWMVFGTTPSHWELILDTYVNTGRHYIKEYRVYERIKKRNVIYIASRDGG